MESVTLNKLHGWIMGELGNPVSHKNALRMSILHALEEAIDNVEDEASADVSSLLEDAENRHREWMEDLGLDLEKQMEAAIL